MRIAFNPSTVAALTSPPNNKDITFDLRGQNIFARGVKFQGTDTNTWRDIKINNVSIGSNILDLRNGSNTTLTNTNGIVTINSTWRPVVDNLTSDSTTSSLSAKQGKVLKGLIDSKSNSGHTHDDRYLKLTGGTMTGNIILSSNVKIIKPLVSTSNYSAAVSWSVDGETKQYGREIGLHNTGGNDSTGSIAIVPYKTSTDPQSGTVGLFIAKNTLKLDGKPIALKSDLPSSLKNPYSLTLQANGTTLATYDGSVSKIVNLTYDNVGAAAKNHTHNSLEPWASHINGDSHADALKSVFNKNKTSIPRNKFISMLSSAYGNDSYYMGYFLQGYENNPYGGFFVAHYDAAYYIGISNGSFSQHRLVYSTDIPSSLKNPYALTISLNGTSQGPYDGSAAKNINITPSSIGAATSEHNHDGRYVYNYGDTAVNGQAFNQNALFTSNTSGITGDWWHILQAACNGECRWNSQIAFPTQNRNGMYYRSGLNDNTKWGSWVKLLDVNNYSSTLDSRYYTESEVNSLLSTKLDRVKLTTGSWNPRSYNLAADYHYNGGDLSISESKGQIHVSINGYFWQNEGRYRVLDTSDVAGLKGDLTVHQYLSATDANWWPLIWGGSSHANTSDSTGSVYKSHNKLSWQTSSQTLYATNIQTENIKHLSIGGGIFWNPNVESATDNSDAASITLVKAGVAGGTTLVLSQMKDANDTIQFKTNTAAKLYHNSYPILTTQNTYVNNYKGYIYGTEITQVNNSDTVDGWHKDDINRTLFITSKIPGLSSYWAKLWEINLNSRYNDITITFLAASSYYPSYSAIFSVCVRQNGTGTYRDISAKITELIGNIAIGDTDLRLYVNNTTGNCQLWGNVRGQYGTMNLTVLKKSWRTATDSSNIGTFFSADFSSAQSFPGDGWNKIGVTQQILIGTFNPSFHTHTWTSITDKIVNSNEFNIVNAGFKEQLWFNYLPINDRSKSATISSYCFGNGNKGYTAVKASGFMINGGTSQQLLRADGGVATFNWYGQSGQPTWLWGGNSEHSYYVYNPSNFKVAYAASAGNADTLDGYHANGSNVAPYGHIPTIESDGVMEIGRYIDFHNDNSGKYDFSTRLKSTGNYGNEVNLPSKSGTLALTSNIPNKDSWNYDDRYVRAFRTSNDNINSDWGQSFKTFDPIPSGTPPEQNPNISVLNIGDNFNRRKQLAFTWNNNNIYYRRREGETGFTNWVRLALINDVNNYYWANVKISTSSSTTTSPTVSNLTATNYIKMCNILLEHTDEINNVANGSINLNYRNSGNISLCQGGGNVGIGTMSPTYKLDVNGGVIASEFHHKFMDNNNYILLAGGGYSAIYTGISYNYSSTQYNLKFSKLSVICNNLIWVDGFIYGYVDRYFSLDDEVRPYVYNHDYNMNSVYVMSANDFISISGASVHIRCSGTYRVGFFYTGNA